MRMIRPLAAVVLATTVATTLWGQTPATPATLGDSVSLSGLAADQRGIVTWNATDGAAEAVRTGHDLSWTPCETSAPFYLATRDQILTDASAGGFRAEPGIIGLTGFDEALTTNGFATTDLVVAWSTQSLGDDVEGADWHFNPETGVETRYYGSGTASLLLRGEPLAGGSLGTTTLTIDYNDLTNCDDDAVSIATDAVLLENQAATSSPDVQAVATALLTSLDGNAMRFTADSLTSAGIDVNADGRVGTILEAPTARGIVAAPCSCALGIHDALRTHEWSLVWPDAALPTNGPFQIKIAAVTPPPAGGTTAPAGDPGMVTLTVFDDTAPDAGVFVDVPFPASTGEVEALLEVTLTPQSTYRVTVEHSGGTGRQYRLGTSHAQLRLGQSDLRQSIGRSQDWAVEAGAGEAVTVQLTTDDNPIDNVEQATSAFVTVVDPATGDVVSGPTSLTLTPSTPGIVSFTNTGAARRLIVQIDPNGAFRVRRTDGDQLLFAQPCPARTGLASATLTLIQTEYFTPICAGCHGGFNPRGGLNLSEGQAFSNLVNVPSGQSSFLRVVPGDAEASYLLHKLDGRPGISGGQMPLGGPFFGDSDLAVFRAWIESGAADN